MTHGSVTQSRGAAVRSLALCCALATTAYALARYRSWHLNWGATAQEAEAPMPADGLLPRAAFVATRAIDIAASPEEVWGWLVQVGHGRAGFYSYDRLDNAGIPSATTILSQYQSPAVGDLAAPMTAAADERTSFRVAEAVPPSRLAWSKPDSTWSWLLVPRPGDGTRLVTRLKTRYRPDRWLPITVLLMEVGDFPMMRRMLLGVKQRAEAAARAGSGATRFSSS